MISYLKNRTSVSELEKKVIDCLLFEIGTSKELISFCKDFFADEAFYLDKAKNRYTKKIDCTPIEAIYKKDYDYLLEIERILKSLLDSYLFSTKKEVVESEYLRRTSVYKKVTKKTSVSWIDKTTRQATLTVRTAYDLPIAQWLHTSSLKDFSTRDNFYIFKKV